MSEIGEDYQNVPCSASLFEKIKFFISGNVEDNVLALLKNGGAERMNYFSDYVTHLICGENAEETDISDANELYEIPAVTPKWILMCGKLNRIVHTKPYIYDNKRLFSNLVFCFSQVDDRNVLWCVINYHGGFVQFTLNNRCSHLVTTSTTSAKYAKASSLSHLIVVTPDWVLESVRVKTLAQPELYHPKLIIVPQVEKHESTTAITGFEPEVEAKLENAPDTTQALLDKLKQRMPWNQCSLPAVKVSEIVPPNVVAPSFTAPRVSASTAQASPPVRPQTPSLPVRAFLNQVVVSEPARNVGHQNALIGQTPPPPQFAPFNSTTHLHRFQQQRANLLSHISQQQHQQQLNKAPHMGQAQFNAPPVMQRQVQMQLPVAQMQAGPHMNQLGQLQRPFSINKGVHMQQLQQQIGNRQAMPPQFSNQQGQQILIGQNQQLGPVLNQPQQLEQVMGHTQQLEQPVINQPQILAQNQAPNQNLQLGQVVNQQQILVQNQPVQQKMFVQQSDAQFVQHQFVPTPNYTQQQPQIVQNVFTQARPQFNSINQQQVVLSPQQKPIIVNQQPPTVPQPPQTPTPTPQNKPIWQQQQQQQLGVRHPTGIIQQQGPRIQWSPTQQPHVPQRQFIQLDMQTHQQLQQMAPEQRALFISKLQQKQRQVLLQQRQQQMQMQQRTGHVLIRSGPVPQGLNPQQQMQWLQQQAKQQGVMLQQSTIQPTTPVPNSPITPNIPHTLALSSIQQSAPPPQFNEANQLQLQRQQQFRIQQLQLQRDQAQKVAIIPQPVTTPPNPIRPIGQPQIAEVITTTAPPDTAIAQQQLVVNAKTKTALANMLSIRLQSGGTSVGATENIPEPSAAGTLRLMTAQHNAALNSNARPQEILGLHQRRTITAPNGETIRPPPSISVPPPSEPPHLQFSPRGNIPIQHRQGPFYGHNPNLKLPPDLFLLGCIFVVVELDRFLEESIPNWQEQIENHGGEVEKQYCSRITHVLCETQRHGVVMQALRDCKRCVTLYWLSDVLRRKQVLPPWTALHLPTMYLDTTPASKHLISLSGFVNSERNRIKHMIKYIGATFTSYMSKHNTLLIAGKAEGSKYLHAKKWATPVVNVQWLTDVMLGHFSALNQLEHIKYQQFPNPPSFNFEPNLVPSLMHAWKMPINISQESYERVKRSASPVLGPKKPKKLKVKEENEFIDDQNQSMTHRILFSLFTDVNDLKSIVRDLGGSLALSHKDCTHLVMPYLGRTNKLLHCICTGAYILPESWLRDSHSANKFLDPVNYSLDTKDFNSEYKCDFNQTLLTRNRNKLFEGKFFYITPSVFPSKTVLIELIESCGGSVERHRRTLSQIEITNLNSPYSYIILTHANDLHLIYDVLSNKKDKIRTVCNVELIYSAILKQTFEVEPYAVQVCEMRR